jgi:hypothetical protein
MANVRLLKDEEKALLLELISEKPQAIQFMNALSDALVEEMDDGGMGSLRFCAGEEEARHLGSKLAEKEFIDSDGVPVIVTVNLDNRGELYELDIWKVDFSSLKRFPVVTK